MHKETRKTIAYFYGRVWREKPVYFLWLALTILCMAVRPFANIFLPRFIIDELLQGKRQEVLIQYVLILILSNWILGSAIQIFNCQCIKLDVWFERYFDRLFTGRCMTMDFEHTENPKVLDQARKAREGMGFYSGGLGGLSGCTMPRRCFTGRGRRALRICTF